MVAKVEGGIHPYDGVVVVPFPQMLKNFHLNQCLSMEPFLVSDDLDSNLTLGFVVCCANHLAKGSFPDHFKNFISVSYMISGNCKKIDTVFKIASRFLIDTSHE